MGWEERIDPEELGRTWTWSKYIVYNSQIINKNEKNMKDYKTA